MAKKLYVDEGMLDEKISNSGLKIDYIISQLGLSRQGYYKKKKGITPFRASEVFVLCTLLNINADDEREKIFYPKS